jgi:O-antigen/teichoic acid export membrane protein
MLGPVNQAIFPRFAELMAKNAHATLIDTFLSASQLISVFLGSIAIMLTIYPYKIIYLWSADTHLSATIAPIVTLLGIAALIGSPGWMLYQVQLAHGQPGVGVRINVITIFFTLPAFYYVVPSYGLVGAAYVLIASAAIGLSLHIHYTFRRHLLSCFKEWAVKSVLQPIIAALLICTLLGLIQFNSDDRLSNLFYKINEEFAI